MKNNVDTTTVSEILLQRPNGKKLETLNLKLNKSVRELSRRIRPVQCWSSFWVPCLVFFALVKVEKEKFHSLVGRQRSVVAGLSWTLRWTLVLCCLCLCFVSGEADARLGSSMRLSSVRMKAGWQEEQRMKLFGTVRSSSFSEETEKINFHLVMNGSPGDNLARCELDEEETCSESYSSANHDDADACDSIHAMSAGSEEGEGEELRSQKLACLEEKENLIAVPPAVTQIVVKANQSIETLEAVGMDVETMSLYHVFLVDENEKLNVQIDSVIRGYYACSGTCGSGSNNAASTAKKRDVRRFIQGVVEKFGFRMALLFCIGASSIVMMMIIITYDGKEIPPHQNILLDSIVPVDEKEKIYCSVDNGKKKKKKNQIQSFKKIKCTNNKPTGIKLFLTLIFLLRTTTVVAFIPVPDGRSPSYKRTTSIFCNFNNCLEKVVKDWFAGGTTRDDVETTYGLIQDWDTSEVTSMRYLFDSSTSNQMKQTFDADLSKWNVAKVTTMKRSTFQFSLFNCFPTTCFLFLSLSPLLEFYLSCALNLLKELIYSSLI